MSMPDLQRPLPRLIFFRSLRTGMPEFLKTHVIEQSRCLGQFFEVIELPPAGDYDEICDRIQPDVVLFESGVDSGERQLRNVSAHPQISKLGFLHADAFDSARATFIADMAEWGVETFFTHSVAMGEYTPEIADRLYTWPNFIDPAIFRDYGLEKNIPILITGSQIGFYPWRNAISRTVSARYPTMICPHNGWKVQSGAPQTPFGENYARLLSAARFVPTCGSVTRDLVRKHLEIPATGACLVAERTAALENIGFRDMENCVFATPEDIADKLDALFADEEKRNDIAKAGHDLVHARHTMAERRQIREWFDLRGQLKAGETIVQESPTGGFRIVSGLARQSSYQVVGRGLDRMLLRKGWEAIAASTLDAAEESFLRCLNFAFIPEALVGLAYCQLMQGRTEDARQSLKKWLDLTFAYHKCKDPDPVAWAMWIRIALCSGDVDSATERALQFPHLVHQELDRIRAVLKLDVTQLSSGGTWRASIAPLPASDEHEWLQQLNRMLRACGQDALAAAVQAGDDLSKMGPAARPSTRIAAIKRAARATSSIVVDRAKARLRGLKKRLTENDWTLHVGRVTSGEPALRGVILEPSLLNLGQRSFRQSLRNSPWSPKLIQVRAKEVTGKESGFAFRPGDLVYVTARAALLIDPDRLADFAGLVFVDGSNSRGGQKLTEALMASGEFALVLHDCVGRTGYATLRRLTRQVAWQEGMLGDNVKHVATC
ncbi:glycosyltransferase family protein [Mycoplana dimorpha]|uniref:Glycosyl transferase family 1 n=1 Tax=Mycoplana dimorpha TaxID=28320 RepID=A0A2T5BDU3_MYCDI|nr:glycosyltransferase [Mycoplana dimorpha]PTM97174.1 glycosyl transferase family 1 [Mycoplana dimorpha]